MQYQYDTCGCKAGPADTRIVAIVDDSSQRCLAKHDKGDPSSETQALYKKTAPPGVVCKESAWFARDGSSLWSVARKR